MELVIDPTVAAGNSSDEGLSTDSEDDFDEPEVEVIKPRVHHKAVLDPLGRSLVGQADNSAELEQQVAAPKTAEELADAAELAERQRGRSGRRGSVVEFAGRRAAMSEEAQLEATAARLRRARESNDANEMQSALAAAAPAALMQGPYAPHPLSCSISDAALTLTSMPLRYSLLGWHVRFSRLRWPLQRGWHPTRTWSAPETCESLRGYAQKCGGCGSLW
jgi:hypothetical protein